MSNYFNSFLLAFVPFGILPINEFYAWSNNQKIHILFHKINELVKASNTYDDLFVEVKSLIEELDKDVADKVLEILNEWYDEGKLDEALESIADEYFEEYLEDFSDRVNTAIQNLQNELESEVERIDNELPKNTTLDFERVFRVLKQNGNYMYSQPDYSIAADDTRTAHYTTSQGSCHYYDANGNERIAIIYICNDGTPFQLNNNGIIEVYDNVGNLIRSKTFLASEIGHGQYITYHNGYFYFGGSITNDTESNHKIRYISEDLTGTTQYMLLTNFNYINGIASYNNKIYICGALASEIDVAELQFEDDNITPMNTVINSLVMNPANIVNAQGSIHSETTFSGGFSVTKDYYYFGTYKPNGVLQCKRNFNIINDELVEIRFTPNWYYNIPEHVCAEMFLLGEPEALTVYDNGDIWLFTTQHLNTKAVCMHEITQVFKQNLFSNTNIPKGVTEYTGRTNIYADSTDGNTNKNPYGTSETDAFKTIDEAVWWYNNYKKSNYGTFYLKGNHPWTVFCIGKNYKFDGDSEWQTYSGRPTSTLTNGNTIGLTMLGNVMCWGGNVEFYNCAIHPTLHYLISGYTNQRENGIYGDGAVVTLVNTGVSGSNNPNIKGGIYLRNCNGNFTFNNSLQNTVQYSQHWFIHNFAHGKKYYFSLGNCTLNGHNDVTYKQNGYTSDGDVYNIAQHNILNFQETI